MLSGVLLRIQFHFFFPDQLEAYEQRPLLITAAYSFFAAGNVLLWPAVLALAWRIYRSRPAWALWGALLAGFGLFARTFHAGADYLAFQVTSVSGAEIATRVVADSYGAFHVFQTLSAAILFGWIVLALGGYLSRALPPYRAVALALMSALPLGVLKGSTIMSVVATAGLAIALIPLGFEFLAERPRPRAREATTWVLGIVGLVGVFYVVGRLG